MKSLKLIFSVIAFLSCLSACHTDTGLGNHDNDYLKDDQSVAPIKIPANVHMAANENARYSLIQPVSKNLVDLSISPPGSLLAESEDASAIQK